ncbi:MAG TPA: peptide chain release factor 1 [Anaerolineae bacterium]|nr:peptide chain release factor 1 [Anaerolineae bacterium]
MFERLDLIEKRYEELNRLMADPQVATDPDRLREYAQERAEIEELVQKYRQYKATARELSETRAMLEDEPDEEMQALIKEEIERLEERREALLSELKLMLVPKDPRDERDVIMEIRAGAGGDEAGLFAADLYRMYTRYAERQGWTTELLSAHETGIGGFKEVIFAVKGRGAYSRLKHESGVHRVQRVPVTEASGRIHTSTATVAVLPEVEEVEVKIDPADLRIDVYRSSGPGGQHMQKNATAVRITHLPTGITVACESERSQFQNKERAMAILRARLYDLEERRRRAELGEARRRQVGSGERSEKIRTYNFPQNRVTDHRIGLTSYRLDEVLNGDLDEFIERLILAEQTEKLKRVGLN